jgi:hypothetical protein
MERQDNIIKIKDIINPDEGIIMILKKFNTFIEKNKDNITNTNIIMTNILQRSCIPISNICVNNLNKCKDTDYKTENLSLIRNIFKNLDLYI